MLRAAQTHPSSSQVGSASVRGVELPTLPTEQVVVRVVVVVGGGAVGASHVQSSFWQVYSGSSSEQ
jgi:hypothetical protein